MAIRRTGTIRDSWGRIEASLRNSLPDEYLPEGASDAQIARAERHLGVHFPKELRELYQVHDGSNAIWLCEGGFLMPLELASKYKNKRLVVPSVVKVWSRWDEMVKEGRFADLKSVPSAPVKADWWNPKWIPIADNQEGDHICIDMDPAKGGTIGQVFDFWHEKGARELLAENIAEWLLSVAKDLEDGKFKALR